MEGRSLAQTSDRRSSAEYGIMAPSDEGARSASTCSLGELMALRSDEVHVRDRVENHDMCV